MLGYLGFDTSNYTTSVACYLENGEIVSEKLMLAVAAGEKGLRQNDALFLHTKQLPIILDKLFTSLPEDVRIAAVGASEKPRDNPQSYMPCFLAGRTAAVSAAKAAKVSYYGFSHQSGHLAAALYGANRLDLLSAPFLAFHVSGGTTEGLYVVPHKNSFTVEIISKTLDISAGQLIDRIGVKLGYSFPAGERLEQDALLHTESLSPKPVIKGTDCCLSGVENICDRLLQNGCEASYAAKYCFEYIAEALVEISQRLMDKYPNTPILFSGGVMSSSLIKEYISMRIPAIFTKPELSKDNACGIALLTNAMAFTR